MNGQATAVNARDKVMYVNDAMYQPYTPDGQRARKRKCERILASQPSDTHHFISIWKTSS
jgi:hypothetical protein